MDIQTLLQSLSYGDLRQLYAGQEGMGIVAEEDIDRIVTFASKALTRIHTQFAAKRHYVKLQTTADRQLYKISPTFAVSDTDPGNTSPRYILDSAADPLPKRILKLRAVEQLTSPGTTDFLRRKLWLNDEAQTAVKTVAYDTLRFAEPIEGATYELELQLDHDALTLPADLSEEIRIPPFLEEALEKRIASLVFSGMGGEGHVARAQLLNGEFEAALAMVSMEDLFQETTTDDTRPRDPGFR